MTSLCVKLKWEKIDEGLWDLFKMALLCGRSDAPATYLLTGAPLTSWVDGPGASILGDRVHDVHGLCRLRYPRGSKRTVWDWISKAEMANSLTKCRLAFGQQLRRRSELARAAGVGASAPASNRRGPRLRAFPRRLAKR